MDDIKEYIRWANEVATSDGRLISKRVWRQIETVDLLAALDTDDRPEV